MKNKIKIFAKGTKDQGEQEAQPVNTKIKRTMLFTLSVLAVIVMIATKGLSLAVKTSLLYAWGDSGRLSGRAGQRVFMRNGRSRTFVVPALVRNSFTGASRSLFSTLTSNFRGLTAEQIAAWNAFTVKVSNVFGVVQDKKGKQAYIACNANLNNTGQAEILAPAAPAISPACNISGLNGSVAGGTLKFTNVAVSTGVAKIYATSAQGFGVSRPSNSKYRLIGIYDPTAGGIVSIFDMWTTRFGGLTEGTKIFMRCGNVNAGGIEAAPAQLECVVGA